MPLLILFGTTGLFACAFLWLVAGDIIWINIVCTVATFLLPTFLCLFYYFLMLPRWRIWAFSNVRNVHELKQRAILGQISPKDGSFLWRFEIKNGMQKQQIEELEQKFAIPDVFTDDHNIPFEKSYFYSKIDTVLYLLFTIGAVLGALIFLLQGEYLLGILLLACAVVFGAMAHKRMTAGGPVLTISNDGITTKERGFYAWRDIHNEQIFWVSAGQSSYYGLSFDVNDETVKMSLKELTGLNSHKLDHVLRTYRGRYEASK